MFLRGISYQHEDKAIYFRRFLLNLGKSQLIDKVSYDILLQIVEFGSQDVSDNGHMVCCKKEMGKTRKVRRL